MSFELTLFIAGMDLWHSFEDLEATARYGARRG